MLVICLIFISFFVNNTSFLLVMCGWECVVVVIIFVVGLLLRREIKIDLQIRIEFFHLLSHHSYNFHSLYHLFIYIYHLFSFLFIAFLKKMYLSRILRSKIIDYNWENNSWTKLKRTILNLIYCMKMCSSRLELYFSIE